jgi:hypothetical protein
MMQISVDIWLRGENSATTCTLAPIDREPRAWCDEDVRTLLTGMLRALHMARHPDAAADVSIALRGFSWIVNPFEDGGVVVALELSLGAVVAGPFDIPEHDLTMTIERVLSRNPAPIPGPSSETVH